MRDLPPNILPEGPDTLLLASEAAEILEVQAQTIRAWTRRGKLRPAGLDAQHRLLYRFSDLVKAQATRRGGAPCQRP